MPWKQVSSNCRGALRGYNEDAPSDRVKSGGVMNRAASGRTSLPATIDRPSVGLPHTQPTAKALVNGPTRTPAGAGCSHD